MNSVLKPCLPHDQQEFYLVLSLTELNGQTELLVNIAWI